MILSDKPIERLDERGRKGHNLVANIHNEFRQFFKISFVLRLCFGFKLFCLI